MHNELDKELTYVKGVGPERAKILREELGLETLKDLLYHFPFRYIDKSQVLKVSEVNEHIPMVQTKGIISDFKEIGIGRKKRLSARLKDASGSLELVWFKGATFIKRTIKPNTEYLVYGKPSRFGKTVNIAHPELTEVHADAPLEVSYQPVYSSTEKLSKKGLHTKGLEAIIRPLSRFVASDIYETLPPYLRTEEKLIELSPALQWVHNPVDIQRVKQARYRLKFEELFYMQLQMGLAKISYTQKSGGFILPDVGALFNDFYQNHIPFELTGAQKRVVKELRMDMKTGLQMNRLVQGDVGSGKTLVALMVMLLAVDNGFQACLMAPTEILATQHYKSLKQMLAGLPVNIVLLTGSSKTAQRKQIDVGLTTGEIQLIIGTHALLEDKVTFKNLGLAVIDEQHRFGVAQRAKLWVKNSTPPHVLVMTATPIPRTLAMTVYGDLDISVIDEMPPGRKPIKTVHRFDNRREEVVGFMRKQIAEGRQVYVVYPLIEESEKLDYKNLMDGFDWLSHYFPKPDYQISVVHGQMKADVKEFEMQRFVKGETHIMIATTVIEVGVNVPNASVMVVQSAERFGLSQLHQLRGRVGRGADQSYCVLMSGEKLSKEARERLTTMVQTNDGFEIAEVDLRLRGPGDVLGTQQSGMVNLKIADIVKDQAILSKARDAAIRILDKDPELQATENKVLYLNLKAMQQKQSNWSKIS